MKTKLITLVSATIAASSIMLLAGTPAQAAPNRAELDEFNQALALKEAGYSFPSIEEALQARRVAIDRAEATKAQPKAANVKDDKTAAKN